MLINIDDCIGLDIKLCQLAEENNLTDEQFIYFTKGWQALWGMIIELPSADKPTGKWIEQESDHIEKIYLCSNCKNYEAWGETEKTPYCPYCGARMEVENDKG